MMAELPVGVCKILLDQDFSVLYGNECFYALYKCTREQFEKEFNNKVCRTFLPEDAPRIADEVLRAKAAGKKGFEIEHRLLCGNGEVIWVLVNGNFSLEDGFDAAVCVVVDITERRKIEDELRINQERFRLALAQTDSTIFDYNIETRVMIHAYKSAEMYGFANELENVPDSLVENGTIHPESVDMFLEMYQKIRSGAPKASCVIRTRLADGHFLWRRITLTNIFDHEGKAVHAVGILEDIDEQKRREQSLRDQSERDALTGLYNRGGIEKRIQRFLAEATEKMENGLLIVDVDLFKGVNDHYGHLFGDRVLAEAARRIAKLFRDEDVIGRIGGDEFIVFVKDMRSKHVIQKRAQEICDSFNSEFENDGIVAKVTCSVGAAISPQDGKTFEALYQKADIALYEAKKRGKNQSCLYKQGMGSGMEWTPYSNTKIDAEEA